MSQIEDDASTLLQRLKDHIDGVPGEVLLDDFLQASGLGWDTSRTEIALAELKAMAIVRERTEPRWLTYPARYVVVLSMAEPPDALVTLTQAAALAYLSPRTLQRYKKDGKLPPPDRDGGDGRADHWYWRNLRPALEKAAKRGNLPRKFPGSPVA